MDETRELIQLAQNESQKNDVIEAVNYLANKNIEEAFPVLKDIFFHPLTNHQIRIAVGTIIASTKSKQIYNLLLSHLILRNFSDLSAVIYTLGEYKNPEIYEIMLKEFMSCNFEAQMEILGAISKINSVEAIEFFSKIYNNEIKIPNLNKEQLEKIKQKAGEGMQQQFIDF